MNEIRYCIIEVFYPAGVTDELFIISPISNLFNKKSLDSSDFNSFDDYIGQGKIKDTGYADVSDSFIKLIDDRRRGVYKIDSL